MSQRTSEMDLYSSASPDTLSDLLCVDREGDQSYQSTIEYMATLMETEHHDARYVRLGSVATASIDQTVRGAFHVGFDNAIEAGSFDVKDIGPAAGATPRLFGAYVAWDRTYFYTNGMSLEFAAEYTPIGGAVGSGKLDFAISQTGVVEWYVMSLHSGAAEPLSGSPSGIIEMFGISGATGNANKFVHLWAASVAPSVNPPAGSIFFYLDPADGALKYRKPSGAVVVV
jgi:hypothetical protein